MVSPQIIPKDTGSPSSYKELNSFQSRIGYAIVDNSEYVIFVSDNSLFMGSPGSALVEQNGWGWGTNGARVNPNLTTSFNLWANQRHPIDGGTKISDVVLVQDYEETVGGQTRYSRAYTYADGDGAGGLSPAITYVDRTLTGLTGDQGWSFLNSEYAIADDGDYSSFASPRGFVYQVQSGGAAQKAFDWEIWDKNPAPNRVPNSDRREPRGLLVPISDVSSGRLMSENCFFVGGRYRRLLFALSPTTTYSYISFPVIARKNTPSTLALPQISYSFGGEQVSFGNQFVSGYRASIGSRYCGLYHRGRLWIGGSTLEYAVAGGVHSYSSTIQIAHIQSALTATDFDSETPEGVYRLSVDANEGNVPITLSGTSRTSYDFGTSVTVLDMKLIGYGSSIFVVILTSTNQLWYAEIVLGQNNVASWLDANRDSADVPHWHRLDTDPTGFTPEYNDALNVVYNPRTRNILCSVDCNDDNYRVYQFPVPGTSIPNTPRFLTEPGVYNREANVELEWVYFHPDNLAQTAYQIRDLEGDQYLLDNGTWSPNAQTIVSNAREDSIVGTVAEPWTGAAGDILRLVVRVRDSNGQWSEWSNELQITASEIRPATITVPAVDDPVSSTVTWTTPGTVAQTHYRVQFRQNGGVVSDTGWVESTDKTITMPVKDEEYEIIVWWQNADGLRDESLDAADPNTKTVTFDIPEPTISQARVDWLDQNDVVVADRGDGFHQGAVRAEVFFDVSSGRGKLRDLPSGLTDPTGLASFENRLLIVDRGGDEVWDVDPIGAVDQGTNLRELPSNLTAPQGMTSHNDRLIIVDDSGDELFEVDPDGGNSQGTRLRELPSGISRPRGLTSHNGRLLVIDIFNGLWEVNPSGSTSQGTKLRDLPVDLVEAVGITSFGGMLLIVDGLDTNLWVIEPDAASANDRIAADLPAGLIAPRGMTAHDGMVIISSDPGGGFPPELWQVDPTTPAPSPTSAKIYRRRSDLAVPGTRELVGDGAISADGSRVSIRDHSLGTKRRYQWMGEMVGPGQYLVETDWSPA